MSTTTRRAGWRPWAGRPQTPDITEAINGLTDRVIAFREEKEKAMPDTENQQPETPLAGPATAEQAQVATPLPPPPTIAGASPPARRPAPSGSFAASIRAMMDEAREGVQRARADGLRQVQGAVEELTEAKAATERIAGRMAETIRSEAADVMAELGQISNDL